MSPLLPSTIIAVIGAGTMGAGIAQVAAQAGHRVVLHDAADGAAVRGRDGIAKAFAKRIAQDKMPQEEADAVLARITPASALADLAAAGLVIEAIVERLEVKQALFREIEEICGPQTILATNTSSLSVTAIGAALQRPGQLVGMHFFNPAPVMALVEVISGAATDPEVAAAIHATAAAWGKSPVRAKSTPGFIVNRVARPFYAEALRVRQESGIAPATADAVMRECGGFRMGPFELMDLIGHDVNYAVTRSVFDAYYQDRRFTPSLVQKDLIDAGWLGRKSGRGFYGYGEGEETPAPDTAAPVSFLPSAEIEVRGALALAARLTEKGIAFERTAGAPSLEIDGVLVMPSDGRSATEVAFEEELEDVVVYDLALDWSKASRVAISVADQAGPDALATAIGLFQALGLAVTVMDDVPGLLVTRTVAMLANEAADAVLQGVASVADVDLAMTKGVNYPRGPLVWAEEIGLPAVLLTLENLFETYKEDRYRPSPLLRRKVMGGGRFHE